MPHRREKFVNSEIYHVIARRIEDKLLFKNIDDYYRGIFSIYEFNNTNLIKIRDRRRARAKEKEINTDPLRVVDNRDLLVEVLSFCLMPNHIHLLLKQLKEGGISKFMNKFGAGYSSYFKQKHNQREKGYFFQGRFVSVHIKTEEQLRTVFAYIHVNPTSLIEPRWKEVGIKEPKKVIEFLEDYKWSSYQDYIGKKNFPSVTEREFILKVMNGEQGCKEFVESRINYKGKIREFTNLILED